MTWSQHSKRTWCGSAGTAPAASTSNPKLHLLLNALPGHSWLRVRFELHTLNAGEEDPLFLVVDGQPPFVTMALGNRQEPTPACNISSRSEFEMVWAHTAATAELRFGWPCLVNADLSRPAWHQVWCPTEKVATLPANPTETIAKDLWWGLQAVSVATSSRRELPWEAPGAKRLANASTSRLVLTGAADMGAVSTTVSGRACQEWALDTPHEHDLNDLAGNYCRSPTRSGRSPTDLRALCSSPTNYCRSPTQPWCYTTDPDTRWEFCASSDDEPTAFSLPAELDGLEQLHILPSSQYALRLSGTLPSALRSLWMGLSSDRMDMDVSTGGSRSNLVARYGVATSLSGTLPASLEALSWQLDELGTRLSGTLPAVLRRLDTGGILGISGQVGMVGGSSLPRLSGTLPEGVLLPPATAADCLAWTAWRVTLVRWPQRTRAHATHIARPHSPCTLTVMLPLLSGTLPATLTAPSELVDLTLAGTYLSGSLPPDLFGSLTQLTMLDIRANNFVGEWPRSTLTPTTKISSCFNRLDETLGHACDYSSGLCDSRVPAPRASVANLRWYRRADDQCAPCSGDAKLWFGILVGLFVCFVPLAVLLSRLLLSPESLPYVSPVLAFVSFAQFVGEFQDFGNIWPPVVRKTLEFVETLWTLNLETLNSECALGYVPFPTSYWPRQIFRLLFPLMIIHVYVFWMTLRDVTLLVARLIVPRLCYFDPADAQHKNVRCCHSRWQRFAVSLAREVAAEASTRRLAEHAMAEAREALQAGDAGLAAARAPATPTGEKLRGALTTLSLPKVAYLTPRSARCFTMAVAALKRLDRGRDAEVEEAHRRQFDAWRPVIDTGAALLQFVYLLRACISPQSIGGNTGVQLHTPLSPQLHPLPHGSLASQPCFPHPRSGAEAFPIRA